MSVCDNRTHGSRHVHRRFRDAGSCVSTGVGPAVKLKSEEERAEHVWGYAEGGMTRGLAVVRDVCTLLFALCFTFALL